MSASRLRLENSSLYHYIKDQVIATEFSEEQIKVDLTLDPSTNEYVASHPRTPLPTTEGRGWVCFDDTTVNGSIVVDVSQEQTNKISVYNSGDVLITSDNYTINYKRCSILSTGGDTPAKVSYFWHYVSVIPFWPNTTPPQLPLITLGVDSSEKEGFQLGLGVRNVRTVYFNIFATSQQERDDLSELIHSYTHNRHVDILDFNSGDFLNYDGTFNDSVVPLSSVGSIFFFNTSHRNAYVSDDFSDLYKYRSVVTGVYESFVEDSSG